LIHALENLGGKLFISTPDAIKVHKGMLFLWWDLPNNQFQMLFRLAMRPRRPILEDPKYRLPVERPKLLEE
jgi:hypothetical protein